MAKRYTITPLNECAALISLGNSIDIEINISIIALHARLVAQPFPGFIESVPAYASLAVFYDTREVHANNPNHATAFDFVREYIETILDSGVWDHGEGKKRIIEIPVLYDGDDLELVAGQHLLTREEVIAIHTAVTYRVFMIGFLPGFAYMGSVDSRIATSRKSTPRTIVPAGSVGLAGFQTGIYPESSPGGWQLIGRTPVRIFDKEKTSPCLLSPGDRVRYYAIDPFEFEQRDEY